MVLSPAVPSCPAIRVFNNNRDDFAPRSAVIFRGLLDEAGIPATGGLDLPPAEMTLF